MGLLLEDTKALKSDRVKQSREILIASQEIWEGSHVNT
jgi:hypothetical protein